MRNFEEGVSHLHDYYPKTYFPESKAESMVMVFFRCNFCLLVQFYKDAVGVTRTPREKPEMFLLGWNRSSTVLLIASKESSHLRLQLFSIMAVL